MWDLLERAPGGLLPIIIGGIAFAIFVRVLAGVFDVWRIRGYISSAGGKVLACRWFPFGPGWLGEKRDRIYYVAFADRDGAEHRAYCKTSLLTGVYFTQDRLVNVGMPRLTHGNEALHEELRRLRDENQLLRQQLAEKRS